jgi:fumarate reductase (CoM/CoB) subunit B
MDTLNQLRTGKLAWTQENASSLWACTGCRQCTNFCNHENEPGLVLMSGRAEANSRGAGHPTLQNYAERFQKREARLAKKLREQIPESQRSTPSSSTEDIGFWPGCDALGKGLDDVQSALKLFNQVGGGQRVRLVETDQVCGGYPLLSAGYMEMFRWHAKQVADTLNSYKTVVTNCSACIFTVKKQYAAEGIPIDVDILSVSEFLSDCLQNLPQSTNKTSIYYHDPCHLARYSGIVEEPRLVLSRIADLWDFDWAHTNTECCGGAGLLPKTDPDTADAMARRRLREVASRGGGTVVTSCATCTYMLKSNAPNNVKVVDLATFLVDAAED